ncbi:MAG: ribonuclease P protein component [Myxococcales bacterium]|nr:ribonuclease P protein component [Myxococcales bacterium]
MSTRRAGEGSGKGAEAFPRSARILRRGDYLRVQGQGRKVHTPHFLIMVLPASQRRLGITVTKRVAGAVGRNRIKRRLREAFRRNPGLFPDDCEVVVVARRGALELDYRAVVAELEEARRPLARAARSAQPGAPQGAPRSH